MAITVRDVARHAGVSPGTVSRILNDPTAPFRDDTRKRVRESANTLGYRHNAAARAVSSGRFQAVTLLQDFNFYRSHLSVGLLDGIQSMLAEHDHTLQFARCDDPDVETLPMLLRRMQSDGLLLNYHAAIPPALTGLLDRVGVPRVWINQDRARGCVLPDERQSVRAVTLDLVKLGHRRIAFLSPNHHHSLVSRHFSRDARHAGYVDAMRSAGLTPRLCALARETPMPEWARWYRSLLGDVDRPTAVICDWLAQEFIHVAESAGLMVPRDLSVWMLGDSPAISDRPIATVTTDWRTLGREAAAMLLRVIAVPRRTGERSRTVASLRVHEAFTVAPPRAAD